MFNKLQINGIKVNIKVEQPVIRLLPQSSSPREPPPQALTDPYLRLSPHTALHVPCKLPSLRKSLAPPISS